MHQSEFYPSDDDPNSGAAGYSGETGLPDYVENALYDSLSKITISLQLTREGYLGKDCPATVWVKSCSGSVKAREQFLVC